MIVFVPTIPTGNNTMVLAARRGGAYAKANENLSTDNGGTFGTQTVIVISNSGKFLAKAQDWTFVCASVSGAQNIYGKKGLSISSDHKMLKGELLTSRFTTMLSNEKCY